ncbi:beta-hexosaminidase [Shewanella sp. NFH-SH190041]|uniref:beta-N-acetylhexosaminidase n=1 Tax=Shewanella sp. NFH-SH190041 TaxID=2950245 RepID=UPI002209DD39|nr:beta-N-acetylhexosaminidase [Shewanella sp. NFH-SH190041]BDM63955.1 beta-hexosaminidase [Shewanella sp. NFH-SH190041]
MSYLMMDLASTALSPLEQQQLAHPAVGGVILFSRNFTTRSQLCSLVADIRAVRPEMLIAVDHEGGRVQRFREGFTEIPAVGDLLPLAGGNRQQAADWARELGFVMALELLACDIDLSFAPVLDLNRISRVIGRRSFSASPEDVAVLASAWIEGMTDAGMRSVGKHFPGHGSVAADSHIDIPVDSRLLADIRADDMQPFADLIAAGLLDGMMPAHVVYKQVDAHPAGFSRFWLQQILRGELGFEGVIFSDDLGMQGASVAGDYPQRVNAALNAGCDMVLVCNAPDGVAALLDDSFCWPDTPPLHPGTKLRADKARLMNVLEQDASSTDSRWLRGRALAQRLNCHPEATDWRRT